MVEKTVPDCEQDRPSRTSGIKLRKTKQKPSASAITISMNGEETASAPSMISVLGLGIDFGMKVLIKASGDDEQQALNQLVELLENLPEKTSDHGRKVSRSGGIAGNCDPQAGFPVPADPRQNNAELLAPEAVKEATERFCAVLRQSCLDLTSVHDELDFEREKAARLKSLALSSAFWMIRCLKRVTDRILSRKNVEWAVRETFAEFTKAFEKEINSTYIKNEWSIFCMK